MANPVGRPPKVTEEQRAEIYEAFKLYIEREADPTTVGFCAWDPVAKQYWITRDNIKDWEEFSPLQKYAIEKQEAYLAKGGVEGKLNATMAIFRLKQPQHGWRDQTQVETTGEVTHKYEELDDETLIKLAKGRDDKAVGTA